MDVGRTTNSPAHRSTPVNAFAERGPNLEELKEIRSLAQRDREVRAHEQAHASVGGAHASAPVYQFKRGPNGVNYAVGGHVNIDVSEVPGDPAATLAKMQQVRRAALAPAEPSPQDRAVAAEATQRAAQARSDLAAARQDRVSDEVEEGADRSQRSDKVSELRHIDVRV